MSRTKTSSVMPPIREETQGALREAMSELLLESWDSARANCLAPDVLLELAAQYVNNTRKIHPDKWSDDQLALEYLRQMREESWQTIRHIAERPMKGSRLSARLFMGVVGIALRRAENPLRGQCRSVVAVTISHLRCGLRLDNALLPPFEGRMGHLRLSRFPMGIDEGWETKIFREALDRQVLQLRPHPTFDLSAQWRLALLGTVIARRGAITLAQERNEKEIRRGALEDAMARIEHGLLENQHLADALAANPLTKDIASQFLRQRASAASILSLR